MYRIVTGKITERCEYPVSHRPNQPPEDRRPTFSAIALRLLCFRVGAGSPSPPCTYHDAPENSQSDFSAIFPVLEPSCRGDVAEMSRSRRAVSRSCRAIVAELSRRCRGDVAEPFFFQKISICDDFCSFSSEKSDFHSVDDKNGHRGLSGRRSRRRRRCDCHCDNSTARALAGCALGI